MQPIADLAADKLEAAAAEAAAAFQIEFRSSEIEEVGSEMKAYERPAVPAW